MSVVDDIDMSGVPVPGPEVGLPTEGVVRIEREHPAGLLRFENLPAGTWLTKAGHPAKVAKRGYFLNEDKLESVTGFVDTIDKPAVNRWIEDHACRGAAEAERRGLLNGIDPADYADVIAAEGLGPTAARRESAQRGDVAHLVMRRLAETGEAPDPTTIPPELWPYMRGAVSAWEHLQEIIGQDAETVLAERPVCHPGLGYAGTPDVLLRATDGALVLVDYKSQKDGHIYSHADWQSRLYAMALAQEDLEPDRILLVPIPPLAPHETAPAPYDGVITEHEATALLLVNRANKRSESHLGKQRRARKAAA